MKGLYNKFTLISTILVLIALLNLILFSDLFIQKSISICLFDIYDINLEATTWQIIKAAYILASLISSIFLSIFLVSKSLKIQSPPKTQTIMSKDEKYRIKIGKSIAKNEDIYIPEKGLYQNLLITGTIGTGKTSSAMYPILQQLMKAKIGMLILDVKGNFYKKVLELNKEFERNIIVIGLGGKYKYNPLHKPNLKPSVIANRLKTVLTLFSNQQVSDSYWLDKVEIYLTECIKLCRLYNNKYVTFVELHKLINNPIYLNEKLSEVKALFIENKLSDSEKYDYNTLIDFFQNEYTSLDSKVLSIIQSEITRITQLFISDKEVAETFCPQKDQLNFQGFSLNNNDIIVLNMNVAEYRNLSKIIAAHLKLDFQAEVLMRISRDKAYEPVAFLCDEYHEYVTENDADFYAQSREAKCISIVSTQSYTSLLKSLKDSQSAKVIIQNLVNKLWFRTDDIFTIEEAQKQLGKEDKTKYIKSISENAKETKYNYILKSFKSQNSNLSETISTQIQHDYAFDFNSFSINLKTFQAIAFISTGTEILPPEVLTLSPQIDSNCSPSDSIIRKSAFNYL